MAITRSDGRSVGVQDSTEVMSRLLMDARVKLEKSVIMKVWLEQAAALMSEDAEAVFWLVLAGYTKREAAEATSAVGHIKNLSAWVSRRLKYV